MSTEKPLFEVIKGPSLEQARAFEGQDGGWKKTAAHYYSVFLETKNSAEVRTNGLLGAVQMAVNFARHDLAEDLLHRSSEIPVPEPGQDIFNARLDVKRAWICDDLGEFSQGVAYCQNALKVLPENLGDRSTAVHFLGRALLGSGQIDQAREQFTQDLKRFETLRTAGNPSPTNEAYNVVWLAVCDMKQDRLEQAQALLAQARKLFDEKNAPGEDSPYWAAMGSLALHTSNADEAISHFQKAYDLAGDSPKEAAIAAYGLYRATGDENWRHRAIHIYPHILKRSALLA